MKYLLFFAMLSTTSVSVAETILCENQSQDIYQKIKLEITTPEDDFGFVEPTGEILDATLNFPLIKQSSNFKVFRTLRQNKIYYFDISGKDVFSLKLGSYSPLKAYKDVELVTYKNSWFGKNLKNISCTVSGEIQTVSMCEGLSQDKTDEKFLRVIKSGRLDEVEQMIDCGADVNSTDKYGCSPLLNLVDGACGYTKTNGKYPQYGATRIMDLDKTISLLIDNGAIIEAQDPVNLETAFIKLVKADRPYEIQTLINYESDINAQDVNGNTALMHAANLGRKMLVKALLHGEPDLELKNNKGQTAYDIAKGNKQDHLLSLLTPGEESIVFHGQQDGLCTPDEVMLVKGKTVKFILKASQNNMFLFEAKDLGIELMAMKGSTDQTNFKPTKSGTFKFTCGIHGGSNSTSGTIMVH